MDYAFQHRFHVSWRVTLIVIRQVHQRAVRITIRKIRETEPASVAELRADKDGQRAQFAVAVHRLETTINRLREQLGSQVVELEQNRATIKDLKLEPGKKTRANLALQAREQLRKSVTRRVLSVFASVRRKRLLQRRQHWRIRFGRRGTPQTR